VWISDGSALLADPVSLPVSRDGICHLERLLSEQGSTDPVFAVEATGSLHRPWIIELERRHPGSVRVFAPSETKSARMQFCSGRFKSDDRDCAASTYMARQGGGRRHGQQSAVEVLRAAVRHRRGFVADRKVAQQRCMTSSTPCVRVCESGHVRLLVGGQLAPGWRTSNLRIGGHDLGPRHARWE
jgi:hypothetical protein